MEKQEQTFRWIVGILQSRRIPFEITGGLAAKAFGSSRTVNDIDIDIAKKDFPRIKGEVLPYIVFGPGQYKDERWSCYLLELDFNGIGIDITALKEVYIRDARTGKWEHRPADLSRAEIKEIYGMSVPVMNKDDLISYKSMLTGEHQKVDIEAILKNDSGTNKKT